MIDFDSLSRALTSLKAAWQAKQDDPTNPFLSDACIQRFEYTYELSHKTLRRFLEATEPNPEGTQRLSFQDLIRLGSDRGLIMGGWPAWQGYRHARSLTSHTYDVEISEEVLRSIPPFLQEVDFLLTALKKGTQG